MEALAKPTLQELRRLIGTIDGSKKGESFSFSLMPDGLPKGTLIEVFGVGKTNFILSLLQENSQERVAWIEKKISIYPTSLLQKKVRLSKVLFIEAQDEINWACQQAIQAQVFSIIIFSLLKFDTLELQRLKLQLEKSGTTGIIISQRPHQSWVPSLVIQTQKAPQSKKLETTIIKKRGLL